MLDSIIRLSLKQRTLVLALCAVVLAWGGWLASTIPIDVFPDLDRPRVVLFTECPGLAPEEVEALIVQPLETALLGATGVEAVRSSSSQGMAILYIEFGWKTEIRAARQVVAERMTAVTMPPGIRPQMLPPASLMGQILQVGLRRRTGPRGGTLAPVEGTTLLAEKGEGLAVWRPGKTWERVEVQSPRWEGERVSFVHEGRTRMALFRTPLQEKMDLRSTADWLIRPRLLKIPGIAEVLVVGGERKQYQVLADAAKLEDMKVSLHDVETALRASNLNASGGILEEGQGERPVRVIGRLGPMPEKALADLLQVPVKSSGDRPVLLRHVATVEEGPAPKRGDAGMDGFPAVVLTLVKQPHTDTRQLTAQAEAALREIEASLPADLVINAQVFRLKDFIDRGIYYVEEAILIGGVLVVIVLFLFLLDLRTTFITLTAIPLSLVVTTLAFRLIGALTGQELSINVMTLGGIAVAMGELVDDAIVDVENIHRRLMLNDLSSAPRPALLVVYEASSEIRSAIVFGTAVVILAFAPLFALSGIEGRLFVPLGIAYIVSILASLVVSLTVTPVLSYLLLKRKASSHGDGFLLRALKGLATPLIRFSMSRAGVLLLLTWIAVGLCAWQLTRQGADFLPKFDEGSVQLNVSLPGGSSLKASNEVAALVDAKLTKMKGGPILHFARRTGRAELDEHADPVSRTEYILAMNPESGIGRDAFLKRLLSELRAEVPGVELDAEQPLSHLISHMLSGVSAQVAVKIHGDDLDKLRELAVAVRAALSDVPGATMPIIDPQTRVDELHVVLRPDALARHGLHREKVADLVQTALRGEAVSQVLEGQRRFDLVVKLKDADAFSLKELRLNLPDGKGQVRLKDVADFPPAASGPNLVNRENGRRMQSVRCNVEGRDLGGAVAEMEAAVRSRVKLPPGYFLEFGGQFEAQRSATLRISLLALASVGAIFLVLMMLYPSARIALQVLNAIPTAFIGGVVALVLTRQPLTVASMVGFVSLGGIAVRNGILLVTHYFHLMKEEGEGFTEAMVLRGSLERLAPVLMTALTAGIALVPLVIGGRKPGLEILYPVATVILGGLITSTCCEFLVHPGLFWRFSGKDAMKLLDDKDSIL